LNENNTPNPAGLENTTQLDQTSRDTPKKAKSKKFLFVYIFSLLAIALFLILIGYLRQLI